MSGFIRRNASWIVCILALALILVGGFAQDKTSQFLPWVISLLPTLGWFILGTGVVNYLYELHGKQEIVRQVKASIGISDSMDEAGIQNATLDVAEVPWKALINSAKVIDLSVSYATTWRSNYVGQLQEFAKNKSSRLRVLLPDYTDARLMMSLGLRYNRAPDEVAKSIGEAKIFFEGLFAALGASKRCNVVLCAKEQTYAYHRFDNVCVITLYHGLGKIGKVATLQFKADGPFGRLFAQDFDNSFGTTK